MADRSVVRVRFAPSPTGFLHIGGLRTALYNYLLARKTGGTFVLRIEDTDQGRYVETAEDYIRESLAWVGITPDESPHKPGAFGPYRQSERTEIYRRHADELVSAGKAYLAFDTAEEIDALRQRGPESGSSRYDHSTRMEMRNSLTLPPAEVQRMRSEGHEFVVRLKVPSNASVNFRDLVRGEVAFDADAIDDQVLVKSDGFPTYHLANVVDDHAMEISHVIRGEEWLPSTPKHMLLYEAFGWSPPAMAHLPLILSPTGGKLSKRNADKYGIPVFVLEYRDAGYEPEAVINYLALLGWHPGSDRERFNLADLVAAFSVERVGSAGVQFDLNKLRWFNEQVLREMPPSRLVAAIAPHARTAGFDGSDADLAAVAELLRDRLTLAKDASEYSEFFGDPVEYDRDAVKKRWKEDTSGLVRSLADTWSSTRRWTAESISEALEAYVTAAGVGKGRIMPAIRIAISGRASGPDLFPSLEIIGREATLRRLIAAADALGSETTA